ncbi:MAG TPA: prepilin peptidase, partial [Planctomycetota bacterium]|nr:prepilin peptidase [Planctomycetota bacterium]
MIFAAVPLAFHWFWWTVFGLFVGSFLNVAIHRLPRPGMTVSKPRRSQCPNCSRELTWKENIPLFSWVVQLGRCRGCGWRIPWRYPLVELLTAGLWFLAAWSTPDAAWDLVAVRVLVLSGLVVATFVDFEHFEIPDQVSIGGMVVAPLASFLVPRLHAETYLAQILSSPAGVDRIGAFLASLSGIAVGGGVLLLIGWIGKLMFRRDAMGLGDVKLLAAAGGFVGPGAALAA